MNLLPLISKLHSLGLLAVFYLAFYYAIRRPGDMRRLGPGARQFLALPGVVLLAAIAAAALLYPTGRAGYWQLFGDWAAPSVVFLVAALVFLPAGSIWAWRAGLRGRRFGWLRPLREWPVLVPWKTFLGAALAINAWTVVLYLFFPTRPQSEFKQWLAQYESAGISFDILAFAMVAIAPFHEEALFRHFLQSRLDVWLTRQGGSWIAACALASAFWALGHVGMMESDKIRFVQIFGAGLLLGWCQKRHGVGLAIAVHLSLNIGVMIYSDWLLPAGS